jgi:hypothetical protein
MHWLVVPMMGVIFGFFVSALVYEVFRRRWLALLAALFAPLPLICAIMGFGFAFMRDETSTLSSLIYAGIYLFAITAPFSLLTAWFVCHRKSRPQ